MKPTTLCTVALLSCLGLAAGCDESGAKSAASTPAAPAAPAVTKENVVGVWELHPGSVPDAAYNTVLSALDKQGATATDAQIIEQAKTLEARIVASGHSITFAPDGTVVSKGENTKTATWTLEGDIVVITQPGEPHASRMRYDSDMLITVPRLERGRELNWRRK